MHYRRQFSIQLGLPLNDPTRHHRIKVQGYPECFSLLDWTHFVFVSNSVLIEALSSTQLVRNAFPALPSVLKDLPVADCQAKINCRQSWVKDFQAHRKYSWLRNWRFWNHLVEVLVLMDYSDSLSDHDEVFQELVWVGSKWELRTLYFLLKFGNFNWFFLNVDDILIGDNLFGFTIILRGFLSLISGM